MSALLICTRGPKRPCWNPYADRGLDEFAVVSAELEAKRERLVAQLGSPLSFVRFATGSDDRKWIPIIICPTLSKAEIRILRRAATRLIAEEKCHSSTVAGYEQKYHLAQNGSSTHGAPPHLAVARAGDAKFYQIGEVEHFLPGLRRFLWMASFSLSIAADIVSHLIMPKWHVDVAPRRSFPSTKKPNFPKEESLTMDIASAAMASSSHFSPLPPLHRPTKDIKVISPPPHSLHVKAPTMQYSRGGFPTAPCTPRDTRQITKPFLTTSSLPKTFPSQDQGHRTGIRKNAKLLTSVSLPKASHVQEPNSHKVRRSSTFAARGIVSNKKEREKGSEKLVGQALIGAGIVLGLGGLMIGYIPAIVSIVCWWYVLPSLRKATGDKRFVERHHK